MFFLEADYELQVKIMAAVLPALDRSKFDVFLLGADGTIGRDHDGSCSSWHGCERLCMKFWI
jgi:hypothetical protein